MAKARFSPSGATSPSMKNHPAIEDQWRKIGLSAPARKALVDAKLYKVSDLKKLTLLELSELPGMSSSAIARIRQIMQAKKINFRS
jgi:hypothetical protein